MRSRSKSRRRNEVRSLALLLCAVSAGAADVTLLFHHSFTAATPGYSVETGYGFEAGEGNFFSVKVPEGNYNVAVELASGCTVTVKAESRRLMLEQARGGGRFTVNVRGVALTAPPLNAPGGDRVRLNDREQGVLHWDDKLTLEFSGPRSCVREVDIAGASVPTVFLAGDSTVTDQPFEPTTSWGQMLPRFFKPGIAVANHAESGETLKSFITGLRLDKILSLIKKGDWMFIQFGHNDMKVNWPQTYAEAASTYRQYLKVYIAEARLRGATPVLVTSMHRRNFGPDGKIRNTLGDYPEAVRQVAREENVALIDLNAMSASFYEALGAAKSPVAFGAEGRDATHHSAYGAYELAKCVVTGIRAAKLELAKYLMDDVPAFDPAQPDSPDAWKLPVSPRFSNRPPRGN
jgi:lysophospholipase L1-like esterase